MGCTHHAVLLFVCVSALPAVVQGATVITVPVDGGVPNTSVAAVPHVAYNGHAITLKAIARGLDSATATTARFRWDTDADGDFDDEIDETLRACVNGTPDGTTCYDLGRRIVAAPVSEDTRLDFGIRLSVPGEPDVFASYPVLVYGDVPAQSDSNNNATASPQTASDEQRQVMRLAARDDALWYLHLQMLNRTGSGAAIAGNYSTTFYAHATIIRGFLASRHLPAYPPGTYDHDVNPGAWYRPAAPSGFAAQNDARYAGDPYAETVIRMINFILANTSSISIPSADEEDDGTTPIPDTNDLLGLVFNIVTPMSGEAEAAAALAESTLGGTVAQTGHTTYVRGRSIEHVVQQMIDYIVYAQNDTANVYMGGWYYDPNSNLQHLAHEGSARAIFIALDSASAMAPAGVYVNNRVRNRLMNVLQFNQDPSTGFARHFSSCASGQGGLAETGDALLAAGMLGWSTYATTDTTVLTQNYAGGNTTRGAARQIFNNYLNAVGTRWVSHQSETCSGWIKGLFFNDGGTNTTPYLRTDMRANMDAVFSVGNALSRLPNAADHSVVGGHDWRHEFTTYLVRNQFTTGYWVDSPWDARFLPGRDFFGLHQSTAWAALLLDRMATCEDLVIAPAALPPGTATDSYQVMISASGALYPFEFSVVSGLLPPGITLEAGGILSGTPTEPGEFTLTIGVAARDECFLTREYTLVIASPVATATALSSSLNPSVPGQPVTFTATVSSVEDVPSGTVTFRDGTTLLGTAALVNGEAWLTTTALSTVGPHSITAEYEGDTPFLDSTSPALTQDVIPVLPPSSIAATATSTSSVQIWWSTTFGAANYEITRLSADSGSIVIATPSAPPYADNDVQPGKAYVYAVRAFDAAGASSDYSPLDVATTIMFTDDPLVSGVTPIRAVHLIELRIALEALRELAGIPPGDLTDPVIDSSSTIRRAHVMELRALAEAARLVLWLRPIPYTDPSLPAGTVVKAGHFHELRSTVR